MTSSRPIADPGAQLERTALAWHRTILAMAGMGLLSLRSQGDGLHVWVRMGGGVLVVIAAVMLVIVDTRYGRTSEHSGPSLALSPGVALMMASIAAAASTGASLYVLFE